MASANDATERADMLAFVQQLSELQKRVLFGGLLAVLVLFCTLYSPLSFYALILLVALLMYSEWLPLTQHLPLLNRFGGLLYVGLPVWSLIALRDSHGIHHILALFAYVWGTDIAAYFAGKKFGRVKIAPHISAGKTWEGLAGAVVVSGMIGVLQASFFAFPHSLYQGLWLGCSLALVAQSGDFFESWIKRQAGVKDSGTLIPGHGGILDRVDGLVFAAPVYTLFVMGFGA